MINVQNQDLIYKKIKLNNLEKSYMEDKKVCSIKLYITKKQLIGKFKKLNI